MAYQVEYVKTSSKAEAVSLIVKYGKEGKILAGGTDVIRQLKQKPPTYRYLIDIKGVAEYQGVIQKAGEGLEIGALTKISSLIESAEMIENAFPLWEAAKSMASPLVRNRATIGGNLVNASPAADTAPPLIALGAVLTVEGIGGTREIPVEEFFLGPGQNALKADELLTTIKIPLSGGKWQGSYLKQGLRNAQEISIVSVAANIRIEGGIIAGCRLALGAVAPTPIRAVGVEKFLEGRQANSSTFMEAGKLVLDEISPISDVRGSAAYRQQLAQVLVARALEKISE
jgi:carbon-monoxide dehydrogenase medium subunit